MEIIKVEDPKVIMVRMTKDEAIRTIASLAYQIYNNDPNGGRYEKYTKDGYDFSIAVIPKKK